MMTETNPKLKTLEKIKSFAIALVGAGIFSIGSTYSSAQSSYRIPRILMPVYEIFGNIGLAIAMLILGTGLMYFAYNKFTKNSGRAIYILSFLLIALLSFYAIVFLTNRKPTTVEEVNASIEKHQKKTADEVAQAKRPNLDSELANNYLSKLETLEAKFAKAVDEQDKSMFIACEKEYEKLISTDFGNASKEMGSKPAYKDFIMYNAKVLEKIQVFRLHKWLGE
ncbi:hypothetical protein EZ449_09175 [Pedobacter frigidisoli]|uniref:Uncharacterized protein n=1 Tax=Pedobacter frigidisoli TaxID=2530455 RepID=A0A4R0P7K4_9SPHI|nr:hypothetical protein [Pedobacter frigidisoli]TCD10508.1 hypothetical protein EZ449_09175 [Pedobacter frigidisoli]